MDDARASGIWSGLKQAKQIHETIGIWDKSNMYDAIVQNEQCVAIAWLNVECERIELYKSEWRDGFEYGYNALFAQINRRNCFGKFRNITNFQ